MLAQLDEQGRERPIAFASRALKANESKWTATEREAFAIIWALESFRHWTEGSPTFVGTDHSPLLFLRNHVGKNARLDQWVLRLLDFQFHLQHLPGKAQAVADALSQAPLQATSEEEERLQGNDIGPGPITAIVHEDVHASANPAEDRDGERKEGNTGVASESRMRAEQLRCPECIRVRQVLRGIPGAALPDWICR